MWKGIYYLSLNTLNFKSDGFPRKVKLITNEVILITLLDLQ